MRQHVQAPASKCGSWLPHPPGMHPPGPPLPQASQLAGRRPASRSEPGSKPCPGQRRALRAQPLPPCQSRLKACLQAVVRYMIRRAEKSRCVVADQFLEPEWPRTSQKAHQQHAHQESVVSTTQAVPVNSGEAEHEGHHSYAAAPTHLNGSWWAGPRSSLHRPAHTPSRRLHGSSRAQMSRHGSVQTTGGKTVGVL